ncbi:FKBP-type peptidyl-prolyl cis-trans isomerase [Saccharicrinis aurantiacus]|uniref:FKBP-type peptidyl-prolyl cis-trans isomerase n=1 Tax=Saccharicrinis aurantiacus TaxID=1849719 RepID=UPI00094FDB6D|nr:FKBP-type peptidyl-prolyl cis-trans isomerase [Saccharicrinis aurantiacus]
MLKSLIVPFLLLLVFTSCKTQKKERAKKQRITTEDLISANRYMVGQDAAAIKSYLERHELDFTETQTGLWYKIDNEGNGALVKKGNVIRLSYDVSLLDGTQVYASKEDGNKEFKVGQGGVESGLEEGVLLLRKGAKAQFIMPPHLAHGLVGDDEEIPPRATIIYHVEVLELKE